MKGLSLPCQLAVEEVLPPPPNCCRTAVAWLRTFAGASLLAVGARNAVVIRSAPSMAQPGGADSWKFFQHILNVGPGDFSEASEGEGEEDGEEVEEEEENEEEVEEVKEGNRWGGKGGGRRERGDVVCVAWEASGKFLGSLAAASGIFVHIFEPQTLTAGSLGAGFPLTWRAVQVLSHKQPIASVAWTASGDGILCTGGCEVTMWQREDLSGAGQMFRQLWHSSPAVAQSLAAASFSSKGFAATAEEERLSEKDLPGTWRRKDVYRGRSKGNARIWISRLAGEEDNGGGTREREVEVVELPHPGPVLRIQWRPGGENKEASGNYSQPSQISGGRRQILLTSCSDGVVRLWMESDGGKSKMEAGGSIYGLKRSLPVFFVGAVIEANSFLGGRLGTDISIAWSEEVKIGSNNGGSAVSHKATGSSNQGGTHGGDVAPCEWLLGVGPQGTVTLWAIHCLDDSWPPRCPRVMMWQQSVGLLPAQQNTVRLPHFKGEGEGEGEEQEHPYLIHCIAQRSEGGMGSPPVAVELLESLPGGKFRWSRMWPPVSALGGGGSGARNNGHGGLKGGNAFTGNQTGGHFKKHSWGLCSEILHLDGHRANLVATAVHPAPGAKIVASLDQEGEILLWKGEVLCSPRLLNPVESPGHGGIWTLGGRVSRKGETREGELSELHGTSVSVGEAGRAGLTHVSPSLTSLVLPSNAEKGEIENLGFWGNKPTKFQVLAWMPLVLPGGKILLLRVHKVGIEVLLVSENQEDSTLSENIHRGGQGEHDKLHISHLCFLRLAEGNSFGGGMEGLYVLQSPVQLNSTKENVNFATVFVAGITSGFCNLVAWKLTIKYEGIEEGRSEKSSISNQWFIGSGGGKGIPGIVSRPLDGDRKTEVQSELLKTGFKKSIVQASSEFLGSVSNGSDRITCAAALGGNFYQGFGRKVENEAEMGEEETGNAEFEGMVADIRNSAYSLVTGSASGTVKFWRLDGRVGKDSRTMERVWECVGCLQAHESFVNFIGISPGGGRIASASLTLENASSRQNSLQIVKIWEAETCMGGEPGSKGHVSGKGLELEGAIVVPATPVALDWLGYGKGFLLLAVGTSEGVHIFGRKKLDIWNGAKEEVSGNKGGTPQSHRWEQEAYQAWNLAGGRMQELRQGGGLDRERKRIGEQEGRDMVESGGWTEIASLGSSFQTIRTVKWGSHGSLVVGAGSQLWILSQWLRNRRRIAANKSSLMRQVSKSASSPFLATMVSGKLGMAHMSSAESEESLNQLSSEWVDASKTDRSLEESGGKTVLEVAMEFDEPLPDYHPKALFLYLSKGNKTRARAIVRHLALSLLPTDTDESGNNKMNLVRTYVPVMHLGDILQDSSGGGRLKVMLNTDSDLGQMASKDNLKQARKENPFSLMTSNTSAMEDGEDGGGKKEFGSSIRRGGIPLFSKEEAKEVVEVLKRRSFIPGLSKTEGAELLAVLDAMAEVDGAERSSQAVLSLDPPAERFRLALRTATLAAFRETGQKSEVKNVLMGSKDIAFVLHSEAREALLAGCVSENATWQSYKALGIGYWLTNVSELRQRMEKLARQQFMERRDGKDCALLYMALDRRSVLMGLLKLSRDEKDKKIVDFFNRDFKEEKHQASALKNAFSLLSQHRFELAGAFFILGGDVLSAASVCVKNLQDPQLGLVICRLMDGSDSLGCGPNAQNLIMRTLLPAAQQKGDTWQAASLQWLLGNRIEALREVGGHGSCDSYTASSTANPSMGPISAGMRLDPDIGDFCALLASKPVLSTGPHVAEAAEIVARANLRSAYVLERASLQLLALEQVSSCLSKSVPLPPPSKPPPRSTPTKYTHSAFSFMSDSSSESDTEDKIDETSMGSATAYGEEEEKRVGEGWLSASVAGEARVAMAARLAIRRLESSLKEHPWWGNWDKNEGDLVGNVRTGEDGKDLVEGVASEQEEKLREAGRVDRNVLEEERKWEEDLRVVAQTWNVKATDVLISLATLAAQTQRLRLLSLLSRSLSSYPPSPLQFDSFDSHILVSHLVHSILQKTPRVLVRIILASRSLFSPTAFYKGQVVGSKILSRVVQGVGLGVVGVGVLKNSVGEFNVEQGESIGVLPERQALELVRFAGELANLSATLDMSWEGGEEEEEMEKRKKGVELLVYFCVVSAAWLSRQAGVLLQLLQPTVESMGARPPLPLHGVDYVAWYRKLERGGRGRSEGIAETATPAAGEGIEKDRDKEYVALSDSDMWRILGVAVWTHMAAYVRKQVVMGEKGGQVSYKAFGWMSPQQSGQGGGVGGYSLLQPPISPFSGTPSQSPPFSSPGTPNGRSPYASPPPYDSPPYGQEREGEKREKETGGRGAMGGGVTAVSRVVEGVSSPVKVTKGGVGEVLSSSLSSLSSGLRGQLAGYLLLGAQVEPPLEALERWIWGIQGEDRSSQMLEVSSKGGKGGGGGQGKLSQGGVVRGSGNGPRTPLPMSPRGNSKEGGSEGLILGVGEVESGKLWRLLVGREKIRTAIALEGLCGPPRKLNKKDEERPKGGQSDDVETKGEKVVSAGGGASGGEGAKGITEGKRESGSKEERKGNGDTLKKMANGNGVGMSGANGEQVGKGERRRSLEVSGSGVQDREVEREDGTSNQRKKAEETSPLWHPTLTFGEGEEVYKMGGELLEAICVNALNLHQAVIATNRKGLIFADTNSREAFSSSLENLWADSHWPKNGWAGSVSTPPPATPPPSSLSRPQTSPYGQFPSETGMGGLGMGIPGYGGIGAWGLGWEDLEDAQEGYVDPPATLANVDSRALAAHPLRPLFLAGSNNTHVYLWEFGKPSATATYGVLPPANSPIPIGLASVAAVRFDRYGHRFLTAGGDGTLSTWRLEVGGRSNVRPIETRQCFRRYSFDCVYVGAGGSVVAAAGLTQSGANVTLWDTLAPPNSSRASAICHDGGALCLDVVEAGSSGAGSYPLIVSGGKGGNIAVHDFRFIARGKGRQKFGGDSESALWSIPKAHAGSVSSIAVIPGSSLFLSGGKDGDMKLWDAATCEQILHWPRIHERRTFLNARGFGAVTQAAVMDIIPMPRGILTCGADGLVKLFPYQTSIEVHGETESYM